MPAAQSPSPTDPSLLAAVAAAITKAQRLNHYGCYDYSGYPGDAPPYVIKDEDARREVYRGTDHEYCQTLYARLCREWVAEQAIKAMKEWLAADMVARLAAFNHGAIWSGK